MGASVRAGCMHTYICVQTGRFIGTEAVHNMYTNDSSAFATLRAQTCRHLHARDERHISVYHFYPG